LLVGDAMITPGVSIGIALFPEHARTADELLMAADQAMYSTKQNVRGHYRVFDPAQNRRSIFGD
jgi:predicted signal transduction protein with EAL and GGDEF domain